VRHISEWEASWLPRISCSVLFSGVNLGEFSAGSSAIFPTSGEGALLLADLSVIADRGDPSR